MVSTRYKINKRCSTTPRKKQKKPGRFSVSWTQTNINASKRLLHLVAAAGTKAILQTWLSDQAPAFRLFLDKLTFLFKMDLTEATMHKERLTLPFFETWESFASILPANVRQKMRDCFQSTTWYQEQVLLGAEPI